MSILANAPLDFNAPINISVSGLPAKYVVTGAVIADVVGPIGNGAQLSIAANGRTLQNAATGTGAAFAAGAYVGSAPGPGNPGPLSSGDIEVKCSKVLSGLTGTLYIVGFEVP